MIHIDTIYESEAFRLLSRHMKDKHAVGIIYATMIADNGKDTLFRELESMADELLRDDDTPKAPDTALAVKMGDLTMRHIFTATGITDISDGNQQALWNRVEEVLVDLEKALDDATGDARIQKEELMRVTEANRQTIFDLEARLEQQEHYNKEAIARRDDKISELRAEISALSEMVKERNLRLANGVHGLHGRLATVHAKLFHDDPTDTEERVHRFLEEAIEVAHAIYVPLDEVIQLAKYVYQGKRGSLNEQLSDAAITLASLCRHRERDFMTVVLDGLRKLESPERIDRIRAKRKTRHGRGPLPGFDPAPVAGVAQHVQTVGRGLRQEVKEPATIGEVMRHRDFSTGEPGKVVTITSLAHRSIIGDNDGPWEGVYDPEIPVTRSLLQAAANEIEEWKVSRGGDDQVLVNLLATIKKPLTGETMPLSTQAADFTVERPHGFRWGMGQRVRKVRGSAWRGRVVGFYRGSLTPEGYAVESEMEPGNVQVYPVAALEERA